MSDLATIRQTLEERDPLPALCPSGIWDEALSEQIQSLSAQAITGKTNPSELAETATRSGLLLWNDDLVTSHTLAQQIDSQPLGSYWHGIMHRREADFPNAKYWMGRAGEQPIHEELYVRGKSIWPELEQWGSWQADRFIDEVAAVHRAGEEDTEKGRALRSVQALEFKLLLQYSLNR